MKRLRVVVLFALTGLLVTCSNSKFKVSLIGTWEWTGDKCNHEGNCNAEIMTDEQSRNTFSADGLYTSKNSKTNYSLKGNSIYFGQGHGSDDELYAEIITIKNDMMLLKFNDGIRRYSKVKL
jgi:hypothetical protein